MYTMISQLKDNSISVDKDRYATSVVVNYLDNSKIKENSKIHKTTLPYDIIFTKENASTSVEKMEVLSRYYNIHYRDCVESIIYLLFTIVDLCFALDNLDFFIKSW